MYHRKKPIRKICSRDLSLRKNSLIFSISSGYLSFAMTTYSTTPSASAIQHHFISFTYGFFHTINCISDHII